MPLVAESVDIELNGLMPVSAIKAGSTVRPYNRPDMRSEPMPAVRRWTLKLDVVACDTNGFMRFLSLLELVVVGGWPTRKPKSEFSAGRCPVLLSCGGLTSELNFWANRMATLLATVLERRPAGEP